jgi:hypothetical protein
MTTNEISLLTAAVPSLATKDIITLVFGPTIRCNFIQSLFFIFFITI